MLLTLFFLPLYLFQNSIVDYLVTDIEGQVIDIKWCDNGQNVLILTD